MPGREGKFIMPKSDYQKTASLAAFFDELDQIDKEAGLKGTLLGLGMLGTVAAGGAKVMANKAPSTLAKARPGIMQVAKKSLKSKGPLIGRGQLKNPEVANALRF